jgi:hypothetical protein
MQNRLIRGFKWGVKLTGAHIIADQFFEHENLRLIDKSYTFDTDSMQLRIPYGKHDIYCENNIVKGWRISAWRTSFCIKQAFQDCGFTGPVIVHFDEKYSFNYSVATMYNKKLKLTAHVFTGPAEIGRDPATIYAIAGHEAIHAINRHKDLRIFMTSLYLGMFIAAPISIKAVMMLAFKPTKKLFERIQERDADTLSTKKLGTTYELYNYFSSMRGLDEKTRQPSILDNIILASLPEMLSSHPHDDRFKKIEKKAEEAMQHRCIFTTS